MRDRALGSTIRLKFTTTDSNGAPVAPSSAFAASDFRIYKDGSATEKATTNGITVTSPFDSVTGRHLIEIDTSNSTGDVGFWASGSAYFVELNTAKTVNSQSVSGLEIGSFSLELQTADVRKANGTAITAASGRMEVNTTHFGGTAGTFSSGRPEVNTTHWGGTAVGSVTINCNMTQISGDSVAADNAESFFDGTGYAGTNNVIPTVSTVTNGVTVTTNNDKTGYSLASGGLSAISTWTVAITGNITGNLSGSVGSVSGNVGGNVTGSVGSISGVTFPSNFGSMSITVGGAVTAGTVSDKTGYSLTPTTGLGNQTANITGNLSGSVGSVAGNVGGNVVGSVASVTGRVTANTDQWNGVTVTGMPMPTYTQPTGFLAATFPSDPADQSAVEAAITAATTGLATSANQTTILDRQAYTLAVLAGACSDPQTASETYVLTIGGSTYTVDMAGQTSTGTRTAPTLTKT